MVFALVGNQNSGKTTLFNRLTGSNQHVGNFPGVTVEKKEGALIKTKGITVVDLPGIYSLTPFTKEETVAADFLINSKPDVIINIVDATNLERGLYLSLQLIGLGCPIVIALSMIDELIASGGSIDTNVLSLNLGVGVFAVCANKNKGISELIEHTLNIAKEKTLPLYNDFCTGAVNNAISSICSLIKGQGARLRIPIRYAAAKIIEGDSAIISALQLSKVKAGALMRIVAQMEAALGIDGQSAIIDMRYRHIERLVRLSAKKPIQNKGRQSAYKIDKLLTNKYLALPIFFCIMALIFYLTFGVFGKILSQPLSYAINYLRTVCDTTLNSYQLNPALRSLITNGILDGVGDVLSFLPVIIILYLFLSLLEDGGYMARVAFVTDKLLSKIGLSGKCFVPMLLGFGCSVPAIMATRTLSSEKDRKVTILLIPFMSCSAKLPVYVMLSSLFFEKYQALVMLCLYLLGVVVAVLCAFFIKSATKNKDSSPFIMELPPYRLPSPLNLALHAWQKGKSFVSRAFTIILFTSVIIWILQSFDLNLNMVTDNSQSMLAQLGRLIAPLFVPLGFGSWQAAAALICGLSAKEALVSTLSVLTKTTSLREIFPLAPCAISFLCFTLLYMPCAAAFAASRKELGKTSSAIAAALFQSAVAWLVSFIVFSFATLFV